MRGGIVRCLRDRAASWLPPGLLFSVSWAGRLAYAGPPAWSPVELSRCHHARDARSKINRGKFRARPLPATRELVSRVASCASFCLPQISACAQVRKTNERATLPRNEPDAMATTEPEVHPTERMLLPFIDLFNHDSLARSRVYRRAAAVHVRVSSRVLTRGQALVVTLPAVGGTRQEAGRPRSGAEAARSRL